MLSSVSLWPPFWNKVINRNDINRFKKFMRSGTVIFFQLCWYNWFKSLNSDLKGGSPFFPCRLSMGITSRAKLGLKMKHCLVSEVQILIKGEVPWWDDDKKADPPKDWRAEQATMKPVHPGDLFVVLHHVWNNQRVVSTNKDLIYIYIYILPSQCCLFTDETLETFLKAVLVHSIFQYLPPTQFWLGIVPILWLAPCESQPVTAAPAHFWAFLYFWCCTVNFPMWDK